MSPDRIEASAVARHIARVAARQFASRGYDATPVRAIVEAAGVTKPTLYYHFGSKEGLARALLTLPMTGLVNTLQAITESGG
ncbi:MAG: TetR/AcrR family transcriptional regulator, partial [Planctomycetia bacterium]|nr:TetR/AcrR family transcriptional regulator [Planctomycetia bacterium]